jgi:hypothetical protein
MLWVFAETTVCNLRRETVGERVGDERQKGTPVGFEFFWWRLDVVTFLEAFIVPHTVTFNCENKNTYRLIIPDKANKFKKTSSQHKKLFLIF